MKNRSMKIFGLAAKTVKNKPKAVILCAGRSTRTYPLTVMRPKALLMAGGKR